MGSKKTSTSTRAFDPTSMGAFQSLTPAWSQAAQGFIQNPYGNPQFQLEQQLGGRQAQQLGGRNVSNVMQNFQTGGMGGSSGSMSPMIQQLLQQAGMGTSALQSQLGFINPMQNAIQRQMSSMGMASQYQPLQTGQTDVQKTSGLGTWLPQVLSGGLGFAMPGLSQLFGGGQGSKGGTQPGFDPAAQFGQRQFGGGAWSMPGIGWDPRAGSSAYNYGQGGGPYNPWPIGGGGSFPMGGGW